MALLESGGEDFDPDTRLLHDGEVDGNDQFDLTSALLHKSANDQGSPFPGQTYPTASVTEMPSAVKPLSNEPCRAIGPSDNGE